MQMDKEEKYAPIKGRIHKYLRIKEIRHEDFFAEVGISTSAFKGASGKSEFGGAVLAEVARKYPNLSTRWLLTGEGNMERVAHPSENMHNILGHNNIVANGNAGVITQNNAPLGLGKSKPRFHKDTEVLIAILSRQCDEKDHQLSEKDKQIDALLKTIALLSAK